MNQIMAIHVVSSCFALRCFDVDVDVDVGRSEGKESNDVN